MESLIAAQRWLYGGIASGLGDFGKGDPSAILTAVVAAVFFGAIHALMPGHGKTVLISYHLGQPGKLRDGIANGAILAVTHVGLAVVLVLAGFAVISKVFAIGGRTPQFELASGVMIMAIGGFLLWRSLRSDQHRSNRDGKTLAFVTGLIPCPLTTFIMSYALARGMLAAGLTVTAAMTVGMIVTIGGAALAAAFARDRFVGLLARSENWRHRAGLALEVGSAAAVIVLGVWTALRSPLTY
jgi:ABC-type nickel/cobalt efflux system permease component RcnA